MSVQILSIFTVCVCVLQTFDFIFVYPIAESEIFDKEVVSLLIKHGADINKINELGETALIRYIKRGRQHVMEKNVLFLIEVGADPSTSVKDCNSALIEALSLNLFNISICLLKANSDVNHVGANCTTALQVILRKGISNSKIATIINILMPVVCSLKNG